MKNNKGITLASLVLTIIVLLILASIFVYSGVNTVRYTKFNKAKSEISIIQTNVNSWYQELKNIENTDEYKALQTDEQKLQYKNEFLDDKGYGVSTGDPACSKKKLDNTLEGLNDKGIEIENFDNYRYLSSTFLESKLGLNVSFDYLANIEERDVILFGGIQYNGEWYYTMEDFGLLNIQSTMPNSVSFELKQEDIASTDILIYNLVFTDANGNPFEVSKFNTYISETGKNEWEDLSSKVSKTTYNNATAFRISDNLEHKSYDVRIETVDKNLKSELVTVAMEEPRAIFKTGQEVNAKMKQLAGTENATQETEDTNITEIKRATEISDTNKIDSNIVSTSDSNTPIYMWFDNGIIYYYSKDENPELNENSSSMFRNCKSITSIDADKIDTTNTTNMSYLFGTCVNLENVDVSNFNTTNVTNMNSMFYGCHKLKNINVSNFDTSKVTDMYYLFAYCRTVSNLDLSGFNTENVTGNMTGMFRECKSLISLDVSSFDTSKVRSMSHLFNGCIGLTSLTFGENFKTSNVTNMSKMFFNCNSLKSLDLKYFNTSNVTNMGFMFCNCTELIDLDISNFNTSNVTNMYKMFSGCQKIKKIYASNEFVTDKFEKGIDENGDEIDSRMMFSGCTSIVGGSGTIYNGANVDKTYARIDGGTSNPGYFTAKP